MKNKITPWIQSLGIVIPLMGSGLIFFIRTFLPTFSNPSVVTLAFQLISLAFLYTSSSFKNLFKGNYILFITYFLFLIYTTFLFVLNNKDSGYKYTNILYLGLSFIYLLQIHKISYHISDYILKTILILSFIINVSLIYSLITNPYYVIGMRATVSFIGENSSGFSGNPHIYARNGLNSLIISLIFLFRYKEQKMINYSFYWFNFFFSIVILLITMVKTAIIISPLILFLFFLSRKPHYIQQSTTFSLKSKRYLSIILLFIPFLFFNYSKLIDLISSYYNMGFGMLISSLNTLSGGSGVNGNVDVSTLERVSNLQMVKNLFINHPLYFIFGNGFRYFYVDVPYVEVFLNFGFIGIILFSIFYLFLYYFSFKNVLTTSDPFQLFISIYIISLVLSLFTQGRPLEFGFYIHSAFFIRFLATDQIKP